MVGVVGGERERGAGGGGGGDEERDLLLLLLCSWVLPYASDNAWDKGETRSSHSAVCTYVPLQRKVRAGSQGRQARKEPRGGTGLAQVGARGACQGLRGRQEAGQGAAAEGAGDPGAAASHQVKGME